MITNVCKFIIVLMFFAISMTVVNLQGFAGVILGGDDLTDHGFRDAGVNKDGWLYIEKAISNLFDSVSRSGPFTAGIAALGSANPGGFPASDAGGAINSVADVLGKTVGFFDGAADIDTFFTDLALGTVNPQVIWLAGTGASNDLVTSEGAVLTANASALNDFVASGGSLMSHGSGSNAYGWLTALLPTASNISGCNEVGATLTADGIAAFPGLSNSNIDDTAGPCHSHFEGDLGGLSVLAKDGDDLNYIIGTGRGGLIQCGLPGQPACPPPPSSEQGIPEPGTLVLMGIGMIGLRLSRLLGSSRISSR